MAEKMGLPSLLLEDFVSRRFRAVTIAKRIAIGSYVADAAIVEATPEAAAWYGLQSPKELVGRWQSLLQHPVDVRLSRELSLRRHFGYPAPTRYVSRIRQRDSIMFRPVLKDTTQLVIEGETYWITVLHEPDAPPLAEQIDVQQAFPLTETEETTRYCGPLSVADLEEFLRKRSPALTSQRLPMELAFPDDSAFNLQRSAPPASEPVGQVASLQPGETYHMPMGRYIHWCAVCKNLWRSSDSAPATCGHRSCHSPYWRTGRPSKHIETS